VLTHRSVDTAWPTRRFSGRRELVRVLLALALMVPIVWLVADTLSAAPGEHAPRPPVILRDANPSESPRPSTNEPSGVEDGPRRDDDQPRDGRPTVTVVTPSPEGVGHDGRDDAMADDDAGEDDSTAGGDG
jgi:hypothetical protein